MLATFSYARCVWGVSNIYKWHTQSIQVAHLRILIPPQRPSSSISHIIMHVSSAGPVDKGLNRPNIVLKSLQLVLFRWPHPCVALIHHGLMWLHGSGHRNRCQNRWQLTTQTTDSPGLEDGFIESRWVKCFFFLVSGERSRVPRCAQSDQMEYWWTKKSAFNKSMWLLHAAIFGRCFHVNWMVPIDVDWMLCHLA